MATVRVLRVFYDLKARRKRKPGDVFEATTERANELVSEIPGHVTVTDAEPPREAPDLTKLTNQQLVELCRERGVDVPKRYKKADLVALLGE